MDGRLVGGAAGDRHDLPAQPGEVAAPLGYRGEGTETTVETDIAELIENIAAATRREGTPLSLDRISEMVLPVRPNALRRCLANLIANARHYGRQVWLSSVTVPDGVDILIDD